MRLAQLTRNELTTLPESTPVYEGVGKMYVSLYLFLDCHSFINGSTTKTPA